MNSSVSKGFFVLTISGVICKILGAFFRLPLTYILSVEGIGVFQLVMSLFSFALVLTSGGITITLSKLISSFRAKKEFGKIKWCEYLALCYCVAISFIFGLIFFFLSKQIAQVQGSLMTNLSYKIFFPLLLFTSLVALFRGIFQGYEDMKPTAISQIIEQLSKFVFGLVFALLLSKKSIELGVFGVFIGVLISEVLAFVYLIFTKHKFKYAVSKMTKFNKRSFYSYLFPATLGLAISSFVHFFDALVIVDRLTSSGITESAATSLFGLQTGVVGAILNFPVIISFALSTSILPKLSFDGAENEGLYNESIKKGFKILWISILPITLGLVSISVPLFRFFYPFFDANTLNEAVRLMAVGGISTILLSVMQYFSTLLQSKGKFKFVCIAFSIGAVFKMLSTIFLSPVPAINIFSIPIGNIIFSSIVIIFCMFKLKNTVFIEANEFFVPLIASLVMVILVSSFTMLTNFSPLLSLFVSVIIGFCVFVVLCFPLLKEYISKILVKKRKGRKSESKTAHRDSVKEKSN